LKTRILILYIFYSINSFSQVATATYDKAILLLKNYQLDSTRMVLNTIPENQEDKHLTALLNWQLSALEEGMDIQLDSVLPKNISSRAKTLFYLKKGEQYLNQSIRNDSLGFINYEMALNYAVEQQDTLLVCESLKKLIFNFYKNRKAQAFLPTYFSIYRDYVYDDVENSFYDFYQVSRKKGEHISEYKTILTHLLNKNKYLKAKLFQNIGNHHSAYLKNRDSGIFYNKKAVAIFEKIPYAYAKIELLGILTNLGTSSRKMGKFKIANNYYQQAKKIQLPKNRYLEYKKLYRLMAINFDSLKVTDSISYYWELRSKYSDSIKDVEALAVVSEIKEKYKVAEKEKENLELQQEVLVADNNRNIALGISGGLVLLLVSGVFILKNIRKKKLIAEQQNLIQTKEIETILKEQELQQIDAMIDGQEKERQRIANELHDNLGGDLASLKMHFHHLKEHSKKTEKEALLFEKTDMILAEAYEKARNISHAKNSGVFANQGLLPAIQKMANKISLANKIEITVHEAHLTQRIENALEITIFRMVQELVTNCIKHAEANQVTIYLTEHEETLNLMVEDNGLGFDTTYIKKQEGMGLYSIEKRIEHMGGTMTVESHRNKGTTVILDIPI